MTDVILEGFRSLGCCNVTRVLLACKARERVSIESEKMPVKQLRHFSFCFCNIREDFILFIMTKFEKHIHGPDLNLG